ncbi:MAG: phospho-N-acetylmuramoyl-pentapeptide-transferase [Prevotella sp.]|nr:phospho-N-acetylmuramoyl-pentapeptide-transferase [Prevotella sp.]
MLYYLFRFLDDFGIPGSHLWGYISFRALLALMLALIISAWFGERFIKYLKGKQITETQRDSKIDPFGINKIGVPSMGGVIIIIALLVPVLLLGRMRNIYLILMIITTVWLGFLGGLDDYIKIFRHNKEGLPGRFKIVGQVSIGLIVGLILWSSPDAKINENIIINKTADKEMVVKHRAEARKSLKTTIPFVKGHNLDYARIMSFCGKYKTAAGWILFVVMTIFVVTAVSNGANLNDGMDGMCAGISAIIGVVLGIFAYVSSHIEYAAYLNIMYIPGSQELVVFLSAFVGALIGFLWYNAYPAQVFMGDTGSLMIGGVIGVCAVIIHKELMLPILCGIFFVESLSVIIQVWYAKRGNRRGVKQRVFKRTPLHDTFRTTDAQLDHEAKYVFKGPKSVVHESKITIRFWIVTIILAALTIITLKIR